MTASRENAVAAARLLGDDLLRQSLAAPDRSPTWGRGFDMARAPAIDVGIFNGRAGEALFLAALYARTGDRRFHDVASEVFAATCESIRDSDTAIRLLNRIGLGLAGGGSLIYALVRGAEWLETPALMEGARALAGAVTEDVVAGDDRLDVMWGSAGAIPGLLVLAVAGDANARGAAIRCGEHLLARRIRDPVTGAKTWGPSAQVPHSGFAHGTTGISYALLRLYAATSDARFRDAAFESFLFERSLYAPDANDWLDHHGQSVSGLMSSWCHGAGGIGFSRLAAVAMSEESDRQELLREVDRAVARVTSPGLPGMSNLCCGSMGRIDLVLGAGLMLRNDALVARSRAMATGAVNAIRLRGYRTLNDADERMPFGPGLWQGAAGIGFTLLRTWDPERLPAVLTMS